MKTWICTFTCSSFNESDEPLHLYQYFYFFTRTWVVGNILVLIVLMSHVHFGGEYSLLSKHICLNFLAFFQNHNFFPMVGESIAISKEKCSDLELYLNLSCIIIWWGTVVLTPLSLGYVTRRVQLVAELIFTVSAQ